MSKRENPMAVRSKTALAQSLLAIMVTKPFEEISISDIADRSGLARQTFYTNFNRKEDILTYMLEGLFQRYAAAGISEENTTSSFMIDYFLFWDKNKDFLSLLFKQGLGWVFADANRKFFQSGTEIIEKMFSAEGWQYPCIKAAVAGITYELLFMWISDDQGLSIHTLATVAENLLAGRLFTANGSYSPELVF